MTKHAILFSNSIGTYSVFIGEGEKLVNVNLDLEGLCSLALDQALTHLWIHKSLGVRIDKGTYQKLVDTGEWDSLAHWQFVSENDVDIYNYLVSLHGYKRLERGRSQRFNLIFLEYASFGWGDLSPEEVLKLIHTLENKLGVAIGGSPAGVGLRYLQKVHEKHIHRLAKPTRDLSEIPFSQGARPLIWSRKPTEEELGRCYLYKVDENSAYPRAAVDERFGIGDPVHYPQGTGFNHMLPGIWRVDVEFSPDCDFTMLPSPVWQNFEWLTTPIVRHLVQMGCGIYINEAWIFPKYDYIFRNWGKNLWSFSQEFERGTPERTAFKQIMNEPLGLVRSKMFGTDSFKYRPDWNVAIVGATRAGVLRKVSKYAQKGLYPIMIQLDALYYLSDEKDPNVAIPGILDHSGSLGGYKLDFCLEVDERVRHILSTLMGSQRLAALNQLAEKAGY
jgi:hypothetical protein